MSFLRRFFSGTDHRPFAVLLGAIAVATVCVIACGSGVAWVWTWFSRTTGTNVATASPESIHATTTTSNDKFDAVCNHKFWRTPANRSTLKQTLNELAKADGTTRVWFDLNGNAAIEDTDFEDTRGFPVAPDSFPRALNGDLERHLTFRIDQEFDKRPTQDELLDLMLRRLDRLEFEIGPGR